MDPNRVKSPRVVSLIASATEIVCALGMEDHLIACSHECDYPPDVIKRLPRISAPKFQPDGTSYEIDQKVKALVQEGLSIYRVDADQLRELSPDGVLTQIQCDVCAVSQKDVEEALAQITGKQPWIVSLEPNSLSHIWSDIRRVARALGVPDRGEQLVQELQNRLQAVAESAQEVLERPTVACVEWIDPLMAAGNWVPELVELAGGRNLFGEAGKHSPWMTWEKVLEKDPEVIIIMPCGFDIERSRQDMVYLTRLPEWSRLTAVRTRRVYLADGNAYFNRPGPRIADSAEMMAEMLHPGTFRSKYFESGWTVVED